MDLGLFDRVQTTHDRVRKRALGLIATWTADFEHDTSWRSVTTT